MEKRYYCSIDIAKLVCSFLIVCIHTSPLSSLDGRMDSFLVNCISRVAVPFFFISSGFLLFSKMDEGRLNAAAVKAYIKRILKLYIIWSAVYFPFMLLDIFKAGDGALKVLAGWAKNMVFSAGYGFLWYLPATVVAVAAVSLLIKREVSINKIIAAGFVLYVAGLFGQSYFGLINMIPFPEFIRRAAAAFLDFTVTTRNGVFEGFLFVALGARLAHEKTLSRPRRSAAFLAVFTLLYILEFAVISKLDWQLEYDMYLFLVPVSYFFAKTVFTLRINPGRSVSGNIRAMSSLIYFTHMLFVEAFSIFTPSPNVNSLLAFFIIITATVVFDIIVLVLSRTKAFAFLKNIY